MMAKMFYTLDEAAKRLKKSQDEVRAMASSGQLAEFRDRDKLMFKVEQVDLLAGDEEPDLGDMGAIPLADSSMGSAIDLASSASGILSLSDSTPGAAAVNPKEKTGISVFDVEDLERADPSAVTQVTDSGLDDATLEAVGSGSGLMDMTRESDDTSLGTVELLDEIYSSEESAGGETVGASGLFEATGAESDESARAAAPVMAVAVEAYDGAGSGLVAGLAVGMVVALGLGFAVAMMGVLGAGDGPFVNLVADKMMIFVGAVAGVTLIAGGLGFVMGKRG